ncbi:prolyl 3-hydroxylase family member 4 (non-enzymatic) L homeolog isoform X1 [Xenopus laevis]|uniref:Prolyl 3-hydroxylase family member 4 (Non-enzymatic) L homeolog isoform X1 n=1 Tax=Xenopus laevis TaxID=8355 RepID=A0A8J0TJP1_XENLA|nr:prolyl 3-hydroxylase family member 4 (non-enzymatic) L homeolog isoform X1 [Xenopus laevis]
MLLLSLLLLLVVSRCGAQYEQYSFRGFPRSEVRPLQATYGRALELYEGDKWKEAARALENSLRLHRLLRDSEAHCGHSCSAGDDESPVLEKKEEEQEWRRELRLFGRVLARAVCLRKCKGSLAVFQQPHPDPDTLSAFRRRDPYQYLHYSYFKTNELEKAVSAAHTFLQKNPTHEMTLRYMNYYKTLMEVEEYLIDLEAEPYEGMFVKAVKTYNAGDFRRSTEEMEQALPLYYKAYNSCLTACEGAYQMREFKDFYPAVAVNDVKNAVQCVSSYMLFDPDDTVMQQNLAYYRFYKEKWDLEDTDFNPREEALRYHSQTTRYKELLQFAKDFLYQDDDEMEVGAEEEKEASPSDSEFEGEGDYEEGILANWLTEPKSKGDVAEKGY